MKKFNLTKLFKVVGITAASALSYQNDIISLVSDNSNVLYEYNIKKDDLTRITLSEGEIENLPKSEKLDFESMIDFEKSTYIFGSGSTEKREKAIFIDKDKNTVETISLHELYNSMKSFGEINAEDFNIEGVSFGTDGWYFLNRGNGPNNKNTIFAVQGKNLIDDFNLFYYDFDLPKINNVNTGFSDGVIINNKLYFIATAEKSNSTYEDGKIEGTLFGCINLKKMKLEYTQIISTTNKFEGLALYSRKGKIANFLLTEDADDGSNETYIYNLEIKI